VFSKMLFQQLGLHICKCLYFRWLPLHVPPTTSPGFVFWRLLSVSPGGDVLLNTSLFLICMHFVFLFSFIFQMWGLLPHIVPWQLTSGQLYWIIRYCARDCTPRSMLWTAPEAQWPRGIHVQLLQDWPGGMWVPSVLDRKARGYGGWALVP
jgi:hypothetical protein